MKLDDENLRHSRTIFFCIDFTFTPLNQSVFLSCYRATSSASLQHCCSIQRGRAAAPGGHLHPSLYRQHYYISYCWLLWLGVSSGGGGGGGGVASSEGGAGAAASLGLAVLRLASWPTGGSGNEPDAAAPGGMSEGGGGMLLLLPPSSLGALLLGVLLSLGSSGGGVALSEEDDEVSDGGGGGATWGSESGSAGAASSKERNGCRFGINTSDLKNKPSLKTHVIDI